MMEPSADQRPVAVAWLPFTPRGLASFAHVKLPRLFVLQLVTAFLSAGSVVWALNVCWYPTIVAAIDHLPSQGMIQSGRLTWPEPSPQMLAESRFLAFAVDLTHSGQTRSPAHLQIEFGQTDLTACSVLGCWQLPYPHSYSIGFNLPELRPWWGAWAPILSALTCLGVVLGLMLSWMILATIYCLPAWLLALYSDRQLTLPGSWRLAAASLIPGALIMVLAICLYRLAHLDPVRFMAAFALHFVAGWIYLTLGTLASPRVDDSNRRSNPFGGIPNQDSQPTDAQRQRSNPFRFPGK